MRFLRRQSEAHERAPAWSHQSHAAPGGGAIEGAPSLEEKREAGVSVGGSSPHDLYLVDGAGGVLHSTDGAATWCVVPIGTRAALNAVWGASADSIFIVGARGLILRSTDRGWSFAGLYSGTGSTLFSVSGWDRGVIAVGAGGAIVRSDNGRDGFRLVRRPTHPDLYSVHCGTAAGAVERCAVAVGEGGTILGSRDGGSTWQLRPGVTDCDLHCVFGDEAGRFYAVGQRGAVLTSTDGGERWSCHDLATDETLRGVWASGEDIYCVGQRSTLFHSADAGTSWQSHRLAISGTLSSVWGTGRDDVYLVGRPGIVIHLTPPVVRA